MNLTQLDLDLDVFQGPFDLLLALVMREEIELAEVPIAEIVVAYIERAYDDGELDLGPGRRRSRRALSPLSRSSPKTRGSSTAPSAGCCRRRPRSTSRPSAAASSR